MKRSEIKVTVTLGQILDAPLISSWERACNTYGLNEWCINEGRADKSDTIEISLEDAELYGIVENE